jgi:hypothetical protein
MSIPFSGIVWEIVGKECVNDNGRHVPGIFAPKPWRDWEPILPMAAFVYGDIFGDPIFGVGSQSGDAVTAGPNG